MMNAVKASRLLFWGVLLAITVLALIPSDTVQIPISVWDKLNHFLAFLVLTALAFLAYPRQRAWLLALALCTYGVLLELAQGLTGYRFASVYDVLADMVGIVLFLLMLLLYRLIVPRFSQRRHQDVMPVDSERR
jgi:VanZ family protein